ncbi:MAG: sigma factor [Burkholderiales bacterium]
MPTPSSSPRISLPPADFFKRHRRLVGTARWLMNDAQAAQEVVQEAYLRAWEKASRDEFEGAAIDAWLGLVVRHLSIDRLRRQSLADKVARLHTAQALPTDAPPSAEYRVMQAQAVDQALHHLLHRLNATDACLWLLREVFEAEHADLARATGKSAAACRQAVHRAGRRLREREASGPRRHDDTLHDHARDDHARDDRHDLVLHACRAALAAHDPRPLMQLLVRTVSVTANPTAAAVPAHGPVPRATTELVQIGGQFALAVRLDGCLLCTLPLGVVVEDAWA